MEKFEHKVSNLDKVIYECGDDFFAALLTDIEQAKHSIDIEYYMIASDRTGAAFFHSLKVARKNGVRVRLLIDGWGSHEHLPVIIDWCHQLGIVFSIYNPTLWRHEALPNLSHLFRLNQRTHRKLVIIDQDIAFGGSVNLAQEHFNKYSGRDAWLDLGIRTQGAEVRELVSVFEASWEAQSEEGVRQSTLASLPQLDAKIRANQTKRRRFRLSQDLVRRIESATKEITIINPYFVPPLRLRLALKRAALKGVEVRIILPAKSDLKLFTWFNFFGVRELSRYGVRFLEYRPTILHAKLTIIDDFYMLGSSNWNTRSFYHDRELDFVVDEPALKEQLRGFLTKTIRHCAPICYRQVRSRFAQDFAARPLFYFLRYWI